MGKRIIQQARGKGSLTYRARKKAFRLKLSYPSLDACGEAKVEKLLNVPCFSAPVAKLRLGKEVFYLPAPEGLYEGALVGIGIKERLEPGCILQLKDIPTGALIYALEAYPGSGPKLVRTSGLAAKVIKKEPGGVRVLLPSKQERLFHPAARATLGIVAAGGRPEKPLLKAGKAYWIAAARGSKLWPRTSAVKMNIVDHPFGSGRGKRIKSKIPKRGAPPGAKVGKLRPKLKK